MLASTGADRGVCLYDLRASVPMRKMVLAMKSNKVVWNPMEPMNFVLANEDHNLYTFDMRKMEKALMIHKDHVSAVIDVAFSPTGREFVSGSYDRTIRIFGTSAPRYPYIIIIISIVILLELLSLFILSIIFCTR